MRRKKIIFLLGIFLLLPGVSMAKTSDQLPDTVRVGLVQQAPFLNFSTTGDYQLIDQASNQQINLTADKRWMVKAVNAQVELYLVTNNDLGNVSRGQSMYLKGRFTGPVVVKARSSEQEKLAVLSAGGKLTGWPIESEVYIWNGKEKTKLTPNKIVVLSQQALKEIALTSGQNLFTLYNGEKTNRYRGSLEFRAAPEGLTAINTLPLEEYLFGVVPNEMYALWPVEALKAQAVVARSYVLAQMGSYNQQGFDVLATQASQVYRGIDSENPLTTQAVCLTKGEILTYGGRPVDAVFHSSSGGFTENSEEVWKNSLAYLRGKPDPYDLNEKHYNWLVSYTQEQLKQQLASKKQWRQGDKYIEQVNFKEITDLVELERTSSGARVKRLAVCGIGPDDQELKVEIYNADAVRTLLGLKSAFFTLEKTFSAEQKLERVTFRGNGWGHGVGMSQYGALGMAKQGFNYRDILLYYYPGVDLIKK
jgi:stage II sporulation protein D